MYDKFFMNTKRNKVLITGGCGFIGSHTATLLLEKGFNLVIIDSNKNSNPNVIDIISHLGIKDKRNSPNSVNFYKGDIRDYKFLNEVFEQEKKFGSEISFVIHFAGLKSVTESTKIPLEYWETNVSGTITLLKVMEIHDCKNIIFSSSATVYEKSKRTTIHEKNLTNPSNPYGNTKLTIENILRTVFDGSLKSWKIASLRYFNPIGAHPSGLLGEDPNGKPNNIFPLINNVASGQKKFLEIYGNNWNTTDGTCVRDYVHVLDVALGHIYTMEFLNTNDPQFLIINIGTGKGTSVLELVKTFENTNKIKIPYKFTKRREGDLERIVADNSFLKSLLKWAPTKDLEDMCRDGWKWKSLHPNGYQ